MKQNMIGFEQLFLIPKARRKREKEEEKETVIHKER